MNYLKYLVMRTNYKTLKYVTSCFLLLIPFLLQVASSVPTAELPAHEIPALQIHPTCQVSVQGY
jgi:hypothetical protein